MIGFAIAWALITLIGSLLVRVVLKRPSLTAKVRIQAILLSLVSVLFAVLCGLWTWSRYDWSFVFTQPPLVSVETLAPEGAVWARFRGKVSPSSQLNLEDKDYVAYVEYDSAMSNASVRWSKGEGVVLELEDGTKVAVPQLRNSTAVYAWNWDSESSYRFIKHGDDITTSGYLYELSKPTNKGATHRIEDIEFFYRGTEAEYLQSQLKKWKVFERYGFLVLSVLFAMSAVGILIGVLLRLKPPADGNRKRPQRP